MNFNWLKTYLPRSLFGRSVLILLVPIISLQMVVATIFIQRHFDGVTRQLARGLGMEISYLADQFERDGTLNDEALRFARSVSLVVHDAPATDDADAFRRHWYDISGRVIQDVLRDVIERPVAVDLVDNFRRVFVDVQTQAGTLSLSASRGRISASNPHQLIVLMIFASVVLTIISLLFLRNQIKPIRKLAFAAEAFGKGRPAPYRPSGAEEVRRAGSAFLSMKSRIERQIDQRTRMLSGVSHDLRTPLTRMKLALATAVDVDDIRDLEQDVDEMEKMLDAFLSFARGDQEDVTAQVDPIELAEHVAEDVRRLGKTVRVEVDAAEPLPVLIPLRELAIKRALTNLAMNAARYGDTVVITITIRPRTLTFFIDDDGAGIPEADRDEALKAFTRLDAARSQNAGEGVGLGLSITKDIARSHGGSLNLEESPTLGGLRAILTLPR